MLVLDWSDLGSLCVYGPRCSVYRCGVDEDMTPILFVSRVIFSSIENDTLYTVLSFQRILLFGHCCHRAGTIIVIELY
jgi:hypothetical protein